MHERDCQTDHGTVTLIAIGEIAYRRCRLINNCMTSNSSTHSAYVAYIQYYIVGYVRKYLEITAICNALNRNTFQRSEKSRVKMEVHKHVTLFSI